MKQENQFIYYGIVFLFLYLKVYSIISNALTCLILGLKGNIFIIPIVLGLLILSLFIVFYRLKSFPKIKLWIILVMVALLIITNLFLIPSTYYAGGYSIYNEDQRIMIALFITYCNAINTGVIIIVSIIKYFRMNKELKVSEENRG